MNRPKNDSAAGCAPEADRASKARPLSECFVALRAAHPLPPAIGEAADKAFFDELSGEQP